MSAGDSLEANSAVIRVGMRMGGRKPPMPKDVFGNIVPDYWLVDVPYHRAGEPSSYDRDFSGLLKLEGVDNFKSLIEKRRASGLSTHVLDLFGGGYFLDELSNVDSMTGVRLADNTQMMIKHLQDSKSHVERPDNTSPDSAEHLAELLSKIGFLEHLRASPKWGIVEGNVYRPSTWDKLEEYKLKKGIPSFDLITIHPVAGFHDTEIFQKEDSGAFSTLAMGYGSVLLHLLGRAYTSLSENQGELYAETPQLISHQFAPNNFIGALKTISEREGGLKIDTSSRAFKITRFPNSTQDLEQLVTREFSKLP